MRQKYLIKYFTLHEEVLQSMVVAICSIEATTTRDLGVFPTHGEGPDFSTTRRASAMESWELIAAPLTTVTLTGSVGLPWSKLPLTQASRTQMLLSKSKFPAVLSLQRFAITESTLAVEARNDVAGLVAPGVASSAALATAVSTVEVESMLSASAQSFSPGVANVEEGMSWGDFRVLCSQQGVAPYELPAPPGQAVFDYHVALAFLARRVAEAQEVTIAEAASDNVVVPAVAAAMPAVPATIEVSQEQAHLAGIMAAIAPGASLCFAPPTSVAHVTQAPMRMGPAGSRLGDSSGVTSAASTPRSQEASVLASQHGGSQADMNWQQMLHLEDPAGGHSSSNEWYRRPANRRSKKGKGRQGRQ